MNSVQTGVFTYESNNFDWIRSTENLKSRCFVDQYYSFDKDRRSKIIGEASLDYDVNLGKPILQGHTLACLHSDGFCKPTLKHPSTNVWFPEEICFMFLISGFVGCVSKLNNRYWLETEDFLNCTGKISKKNKPIMPTVFPYTISPLGATTPTLSQQERFSQKHFPKTQHNCIPLSILICLSVIVKVFI